MIRCSLISILLIMACFAFFSDARAQDGSGSGKYWIFFSDKGELSQEEIESRLDSLALKATAPNLKKRAISSQDQRLFDYSDLSLEESYIDSLTDLGLEIENRSKWFNAVSVAGPDALINIARNLDFVDSVRPVGVYVRPVPETEDKVEPLPKLNAAFDLDYGYAFNQLQQIRVPSVHQLGLSGEGVLVCILDTGFDPDHEALDHLEVVATRDFINGDDDVKDQLNAQRSHGTSVLSCLAGNEPGNIIGSAYNISVCLAKTEIVDQEIRQEEDNFVAALEWADSIGCRVVTASLGYIDWYNTSDLDGNTALVTIASDLAVEKGISVLTAAGNEGNLGPTSIIAPADGDYVIAVGGVWQDDSHWSGSSRGPTADGRIKPDVCANAVGVYVANYNGGYNYSNGTSFATPLTAGVVALMIENDPDITSFEIRNALISTARKAGPDAIPNNRYGYGIADALAAVGFEPTQFEGDILAYPNPFEDVIFIGCNTNAAGTVRGSIHTIDGIQVWTGEVQGTDEGATLAWDGKNANGEEVANGVYIIFIEGPGLESTTKLFKVSR